MIQENSDSQAQRRILLVLFIGVLMGALDIAIVGPALPAIQTTFDLMDGIAEWSFTIFILFNLIGALLMAKLADRYGRRDVYVIDVLLFAIGSLLVAISPDFSILLLGRSIQGLGAGGIFPVASAVIADTFPPDKRGGALGMIGAVFGISFLIGPILAGFLLEFDWRYLFIINLPIALLVIIISSKTLPSEKAEEKVSLDKWGIITASLLLGALTLGISGIRTNDLIGSLVSPFVWPLLLSIPLLTILFRSVEQKAEDPVLHMSLFKTRQSRLTTILAGGAGLGEGSLVFIPSLTVLAFGVAPSAASFMLLPVVIAMSFGSPLAGRTLDRRGSKTVILIGTFLTFLGMVALGLYSTNLVVYYIASGFIGFGLGFLLGAPLRYIMINEADESQRAVAQGSLTLFTGVGQLLSGALIGAIIVSNGGGIAGRQIAYIFVAAVMLMLLFISVLLKNHHDEMEQLDTSNETISDAMV